MATLPDYNKIVFDECRGKTAGELVPEASEQVRTWQCRNQKKAKRNTKGKAAGLDFPAAFNFLHPGTGNAGPLADISGTE
jgi:hypothetical protein